MYGLNSLRKKIICMYKHACLLDVQALKPGNVGIHSQTIGLSTDNFLRSADVSAEPLTESTFKLGERIWRAVQATHQAVETNTNLGIILLVSPLIQAMFEKENQQSLASSLAEILENSTVEDAINVYRAIRLAEPGGLGSKDNQDISEEPTISLLNTMKISASWDQILVQYNSNYDGPNH